MPSREIIELLENTQNWYGPQNLNDHLHISEGPPDESDLLWFAWRDHSWKEYIFHTISFLTYEFIHLHLESESWTSREIDLILLEEIFRYDSLTWDEVGM